MTWLNVASGSAFGVANLPYGIFSAGGRPPRVGVRIGDSVLDPAAALGDAFFDRPALNPFMAEGPTAWDDARRRITELLADERHRPVVEPALTPLAGARLHLPFVVGDYVDFYASEHHASNIGRMFRPNGDP